ncbi:MAG TPA: class IV adenylate cyclase [Candidatus Saccharimonadales bacterium]|jgi:adenylate cyclase class 2
MKPEIEVKFLHADHDALRAKLLSLGAVCAQPMRLMRRRMYDFPDGRLYTSKNGLARVRDEGNKVTMTYKQLNDRSLHGTLEVNMQVDSFEQACTFLEQLGLTAKSYQETRRESWRLNNFEIELDEWPWAQPYIEIEGSDEQSLADLAHKLDLDWERRVHGTVEVVYRAEYNVSDDEFNTLSIISFNDPAPQWLQAKHIT